MVMQLFDLRSEFRHFSLIHLCCSRGHACGSTCVVDQLNLHCRIFAIPRALPIGVRLGALPELTRPFADGLTAATAGFATEFWDAHWHGEEYDPVGRA
jgi:hypothetical protein